ncbi:MAG TPA: hypothetical protein VF906_08485 [Candidatus Bathyarchaeia archaeon]
MPVQTLQEVTPSSPCRNALPERERALTFTAPPIISAMSRPVSGK